MKIGVISDIHDNLANLKKALEYLNNEKVFKILFCGDLTSPSTTSYFKISKCPILAVFGNIDRDRVNIINEINKDKIDITYAPKLGLMWDLKIANYRFALIHGHQNEIVKALIDSKLYNCVLTGHTHLAQIKKINKTLWINPGCICGWTGLDVKPAQASLAILDLKNLNPKIITIN